AAEQRGRTTEAALPLLEQALGYLTRGELLEEEGGLWVHAARLHGQAMLRQCRRWLAQIYARQGRLWLTSEHFRALLQADPADEEALREWLHVLLQHGQEREARRCYEEVQALAAQQGETLPSWEQLRLVKPPADMVCLTQTKNISQGEQQQKHTLSTASGVGELLSHPQDVAVTWDHTALLRLTAFIFCWRSFAGQRALHEFEALFHRELITMANPSAQPPTEPAALERRQVLLGLASLPLIMLDLPQQSAFRSMRLQPSEELLLACAASVTACWHLLQQRDLDTVEQSLRNFLPQLRSWAGDASPLRRQAASLATQGMLQLSLVAHHRLQLQRRLQLCQEAVILSRLAGNPALEVKALTFQASASFHLGQWGEMVRAYEAASQITEAVPSLLQAKTLLGLARAAAVQGRVTEALQRLSQARELCPEEQEQESLPAFLAVDESRWLPVVFDASIRLTLARCQMCQEHYRQVEQTLIPLTTSHQADEIPDRLQLVLWHLRAQAALGEGDLERFYATVQETATRLQRLPSQKRKQELVNTWRQARQLWPHERRLLELADVLL
ncbi:bacterial transcriptional activator domain-containing protein, partial [Thermogemmatispora aurantia]|uniref:bacterial transcriptional activator domain-containing protein n=1 Tax=Thermogemmatispora aurantia TaxID=2045279 RepID=UPI00147858B9